MTSYSSSNRNVRDMVDVFNAIALADKPNETNFKWAPVSIPTDVKWESNFIGGFDRTMASYPLVPTPPKRYDFVESFNAIALAGKPNETKRLPELVPINTKQESGFFGGFDFERLAVNTELEAPKRPPIHSEHSSSHSRDVPLPLPVVVSMPSISCRLLMPPPSMISPSRPHSDPLPSPGALSCPSISVGVRSRPRLDVAPNRPRAISVPPSPSVLPSPSVPPSSSSFSANKNTTQCSGMTYARRQCTRKVKPPPTHSHIDPIPVVYCYQHRDAIYSAQTGFYIRQKGKEDRYVEFSNYIPKYLQRDTQLALRVEMEKAVSPADVPGYIYTYEIRDPKRPSVIQLKIGRTVNLVKRLDQWDKQCGSKMQIVRGWWPDIMDDSDDDGTSGSLLKGSIKAGEPGPLCHRVERLVRIELADLVVHTPYLNPGFPKVDNSDPPSSAVGSSAPKETAMKPCPDCGIIHREIFAFPRPEKGRYKRREWELLVKPVIEKWGKFVSEYYA